MVTCEFIKGTKPSYYEVTVAVIGAPKNYSIGVYTKAPFDAVLSALRACVKESYTLVVEQTKVLHSEYESLDSACALLSRLRFIEYTTREVEKVVTVTELISKEL